MAEQQLPQMNLGQEQPLQEPVQSGPEPKPKITPAPAIVPAQPAFGDITAITEPIKPKKEQQVLPVKKAKDIGIGDLKISEEIFKNHALASKVKNDYSRMSTSTSGSFLVERVPGFGSQKEIQAEQQMAQQKETNYLILKNKEIQKLTEGGVGAKVSNYLFGDFNDILKFGGNVEKYIKKNAAGNNFIDEGLLRSDMDKALTAKGAGNYMKEYLWSQVGSAANLQNVLSVFEARDEINKKMPTGMTEDQQKAVLLQARSSATNQFKDQIDTHTRLFADKVKKIQSNYAPQLTDLSIDTNFYWEEAQKEAAQQMSGVSGIYQPAFQDSYERRAKEIFDTKYAQFVNPKYDEVADKIASDIKVELSKTNESLGRINTEVNTALKAEYQKLSATQGQGQLEQFTKDISDIINRKNSERKGSNEAYAQSIVDMSAMPGIVGTAAVGRMFGNTLVSAYGSLKSKAALIANALGLESDALDAMKYSGKTTELEYAIEKLPLGDNWLKPGYWAQSIAQSGPSMGLSILATALTKNPYIGGIIAFGSESIENSGAVMERVLQNTGDLDAARKAAGESFVKNFPTVLSEVLVQRMFAPLSALKAAKAPVSKRLGEIGTGIASNAVEEAWQTSTELSSGADAKLGFAQAFFSKDAMNAAIEGGAIGGIFGGASLSMTAAQKAFFDKKNIISPRTQAVAASIMTNGETATMAGVQIDALSNNIDDATLGDGMKEIERVAKTIEDAKKIGLNPQQTQIFASLTQEVSDLKTSLNSIGDESVRKAIEKQIADKQKQIDGVIDGTVPIATIELQPGLVFTSTTDGIRNVMNAPEVQAEVAAGNVKIYTDDAKLNSEIEQAKSAAKPAEPAKGFAVDYLEANDKGELVPTTQTFATEQEANAFVEQRKNEGKIYGSGTTVRQITETAPATMAEAPITEIKTQEDATKISTGPQQEVGQPSNLIQPTGVEQGQQEVGQGEGGVRQATQQTADARNSDFGSQAQQVIQEITALPEQTPVVQNYTRTINPGQEVQLMDELAQQVTEGEERAVRQMGQQVVDKVKQWIAATGYTAPVAAPMAEVAPVAEAPMQMDEMMTADTKNPTVLGKVSKFLDDIDNAIGKELNSGKLSDATRVIPLAAMRVIVKALNALVKGGMTLQEAIRKVAADNNYKEADVTDAINTINTIENLGVSEGLSEAELPGYDRMMNEVQGIVDKSKQRGVDDAGVRENVMNYVTGSKVYETATDVQRDKLIRDVNKMFGVTQKSAPRPGRVLGDIANMASVTLTEKAALQKQIKDLARGAKDAITAWRNASTALGKDIKSMVKDGKLTAKQAANIIQKFGKINILSPKAVGKFVDYMSKVFADAEYENKLSAGKKVRKDISKLSKNKDKDANLREVGKRFLDIDPSMVDDIDAYNDMAAKIKESLAGSKARKGEVSFASMVNIDDASNYIKDVLASQDQKLRAETAAEIQELMGVDASDFSYDDMIALLKGDKPISKDNESIIRATINKAFGIYSSIIKKALSNGVDPLTDAPFEVSESQKSLINRFMEMDLGMLTPKEALQAVDALNNFIQNKSTAKMESVVADYTGRLNAKKVKDKRIKSVPLSKYFSKSLGRILAEQATNLGPLFERMFKGVKRGGYVEDMSGLTKVKNGKALAEAIVNRMAKEFVDTFYKSKPNGETFNSVKNMVERGMIAFLSRNVIGTQTERDAEFNRRKNILKESIEALSRGSEKEKKKAKEYKEIYDKLGVEASAGIQDITSNADQTNVEAVNWWTDKWSEIYPQLSDLSKNVYNRILDNDTDYNPDRYKMLEGVSELADLTNEESAFHYNTGEIYKKETGVLMSASRPESLPKGKNNKPTRYIDLSFDSNNANSMYDALIDIHTAAAVRQVDAFFNSEDFSDIVTSAEDRGVLERRVSLYIKKIRNKAPFENDELSKGIKRLNNLAAVGVGQALGGIAQPFKQVIPVIANTLVNAGKLDVGAMFDNDKNNFINRSGYSIANRGVESQAQIDSINKIIDVAASSNPQKMLKAIENVNKMWLDIFLVKPDAWVARSSWITYYEQSLKEQGIDSSTIDWGTHEVNEEAGNYAQRMVDRQQNVSDPAQSGKLLADSDNSFKNLIVKMTMPFASFRLNQSVRLANDISTLSSMSTATKEDKVIAARSLAGYAIEVAVFRGMSIGIAILLGNAAKYLMGEEEKEKDKEQRINNLIKGQVTSTATELLSPVPVLDKVVQEGLYTLNDEVQNVMEVSEKDKLNIYKPRPDDFLKSLGLLGITLDRASQLYELTNLSALDGEYEDDYGRKRKLREKDKEVLKTMIGPSLASALGILPTEVNSVIRYSLKDAKKRAIVAGGRGKGKKSGLGNKGLSSQGLKSGGLGSKGLSN